MFSGELAGLNAIINTHTVRVPKPIKVGTLVYRWKGIHVTTLLFVLATFPLKVTISQIDTKHTSFSQPPSHSDSRAPRERLDLYYGAPGNDWAEEVPGPAGRAVGKVLCT